MYIFSVVRPVPGIDPRMPITRGWAAVLQVSTVAQRWREVIGGVFAFGFGLAAASAGVAGSSRSAATASSLDDGGTAGTIAGEIGRRASWCAASPDGVEWS
jgi:hypothetical protein